MHYNEDFSVFIESNELREGDIGEFLSEYMVIYPVFLIRFEMKENDNFDEMERKIDKYM